RIPAPLRGFENAGDAQLFDVTLADGRVASVQPSADQQQEACGMLLSAFVDAHAHIDKNYTVREVGAAQGNLFAAITRMAQHRSGWTEARLRPRMARAIDAAWRAGTRALRTHLDWDQGFAPLALPVFEQLRE